MCWLTCKSQDTMFFYASHGWFRPCMDYWRGRLGTRPGGQGFWDPPGPKPQPKLTVTVTDCSYWGLQKWLWGETKQPQRQREPPQTETTKKIFQRSASWFSLSCCTCGGRLLSVCNQMSFLCIIIQNCVYEFQKQQYSGNSQERSDNHALLMRPDLSEKSGLLHKVAVNGEGSYERFSVQRDSMIL